MPRDVMVYGPQLPAHCFDAHFWEALQSADASRALAQHAVEIHPGVFRFPLLSHEFCQVRTTFVHCGPSLLRVGQLFVACIVYFGATRATDTVSQRLAAELAFFEAKALAYGIAVRRPNSMNGWGPGFRLSLWLC